jgi:tripartite-type tricarboxylate transporter receptor subunit TctC
MALLTFVAAAGGDASAQSYPTKPIKIIVPFDPGGPADIMARSIGNKLTERLGKQIIVENKGGASGTIAMELAKSAPPDGYTLVVVHDGTMAVNLALLDKLTYDPVKDFLPITVFATSPPVLVVNPSLPVKSVDELVKLAKARPGKLNYATPGVGSGGHLAGERFKKLAGIDMMHIPYKGGAPAAVAVVSGESEVSFMAPGAAEPHVKSGKLRALAVTSAQRYALMPDLPTMSESGFPQFDQKSWWGLAAPAGTPKPIIDKLYTEIAAILNSPETKQEFANRWVVPVANTPEEFAAMIKTEIPYWAEAVADAGAKSN